MSRAISIFALLLALLLAISPGSTAARSEAIEGSTSAQDMRARPATPCNLVKGPLRAVVAIIDPQTVRLDDGTELRLLGALAPISLASSAARWPPTLAAQAALDALLSGQSVELGYDKTRRNRYGQVLAQLYRVRGSERLWVQKELIEAGHARVQGSRDNHECLGELLAAEQRARKARRGLWSHAAFQIRPAWRTRELMRYRQRFELVEGEVREVARAGNRTYLNFGRRWQEDFTVVIDGRDRRSFEQAGIDLAALKGKRIRVRGWIERRNGPLIEASYPAQIEVLEKKRARRTKRTPTKASE